MPPTVRRSDNGKGWVGRWRDPDGASRCKTFPTKAEAMRHATIMEADKAKGSYIDPAAGKVTFGAYTKKWMANQVYSDGTAKQVEGNLRLHVLPKLGHRPLRAITRSEIQGLVKRMTVAPSTVELIYTYVATILRAAVADKLIQETPCVGIKLPPKDPSKVVPLTYEQVVTATEMMTRRYQAMVVLAAGSGLRQGECFGITVDRVDFDAQTITVDRQVVTGSSRPHLGPPKTDASYRIVPVSTVVLDALADHKVEFPPGPPGLPVVNRQGVEIDQTRTGLIFTNRSGNPLNRSTFGDSWRPVAEALGLPDRTGLHVLRHTYASVLISGGMSITVVQERLGHASATETLDTYSHLMLSDDDRTRETIENALGGLGKVLRPDDQ